MTIKKFSTALLMMSAALYSFVAAAGETEVRKAMAGMVIGGSDIQLQAAPMPGMFEVIAGGQLYYVTDDGHFMFKGTAFDLVKGVDLTEPRMNYVRAQSLKAVDDAQTIIFSPKDGKVKYRVNVFTDFDCGYCFKMHREIDGYLERGIEVRYFFYPRAGVNSPSARKAESVWCADDRHQAFIDAQPRVAMEARRCENPVAKGYQLGRELGVRATPTIMTDGGEVIPGYRPPADLEKILQSL